MNNFAKQFHMNMDQLRQELAHENISLWNEVKDEMNAGFSGVNVKLDQLILGSGGAKAGGEGTAVVGTRAIKNDEAKQFWSEYFEEADEV